MKYTANEIAPRRRRVRLRPAHFGLTGLFCGGLLSALLLSSGCRTGYVECDSKGLRTEAFQLKSGSREAVVDGNLVYMRAAAVKDAAGRLCIHSAEAEFLKAPLAPSGRAALRSGDRPVLLLDPGHGGVEKGAVGKLYCEKDLNLEFAEALGAALDAEGWQVRFTRRSDIRISLDERAALGEKYGATLFISIHHNAGKNIGQRGIEAYSLTPEGFGSTNTPQMVSAVAHPGSPVLSASRQLAFLCMKHINTTGVGADRGVRYARFRVLCQSRCPAVLLELGFVSCPDEEKVLRDPERRGKLVAAVVAAVKEFLNPEPEKKTLPCP